MARYRRPLIIGLIVLLCVGVGEFWLFAAHRLGDYVHERAFGGVSIADMCQSSDISGFPFRLKLSCEGFAAPVRAGGETFYFGAEEAHGVASLFSPDHILLTFSSPLVVQKAGGAPLAKLRHDGMTLDVAWSPSGLSQAQLDMKSLDWRPDSPLAGVAFNIQTLQATVSAADQNALRYDLTGDGLTVPALQSLLQISDPARFTLGGAVTPSPAPADDWRAAIDDWRQKSGAVTVDHFDWRAGDLHLKVDGTLALDDAHRPAGKLNVTAEGAGPVFARLGIPAATAAQAGALLGALLGKPAAQGAQADTISLPLTLANGRVYLGPVRLPATVSPLY